MAAPFKDRLDAEAVTRLAEHMQRSAPEFPVAAFVADATAGLEALELMARVAHIAGALARHLPADFEAACAVLVGALGPAVSVDGGFEEEHPEGVRGFALLALTRFVADQGLAAPEISMQALHAMTQRMSAEFDVRPFLEHHPEATWARLHAWSSDPSPHVRRLTSEGTRPRLPWGKRVPGLIEDPSRGLALIERLKDDPVRYVQRSVANHLNDVSKDHPEVVIAVARRWLADATPDRAWIVRHALRGRLKAADPAALSLFGYPDPPAIALETLSAAASTPFTGALPYAFTLRSTATEAQRALVDVVVHYVKARGGRSPKVFRVADRLIAPGAPVAYERTLSFKPISTRRHYPGAHRLEIRVNGRVLGGADFTLEPE